MPVQRGVRDLDERIRSAGLASDRPLDPLLFPSEGDQHLLGRAEAAFQSKMGEGEEESPFQGGLRGREDGPSPSKFLDRANLDEPSGAFGDGPRQARGRREESRFCRNRLEGSEHPSRYVRTAHRLESGSGRSRVGVQRERPECSRGVRPDHEEMRPARDDERRPHALELRERS